MGREPKLPDPAPFYPRTDLALWMPDGSCEITTGKPGQGREGAPPVPDGFEIGKNAAYIDVTGAKTTIRIDEPYA